MLPWWNYQLGIRPNLWNDPILILIGGPHRKYLGSIRVIKNQKTTMRVGTFHSYHTTGVSEFGLTWLL